MLKQARLRLPSLLPTGKTDVLPAWKINALATYLFVHQSRFVQFSLITLQVMVSFGLVFFPHHIVLEYLIAITLLVLVVVGTINAGYNIILLHKFLHSDENYEEESNTQKRLKVKKVVELTDMN
jgi:hypothetical protein